MMAAWLGVVNSFAQLLMNGGHFAWGHEHAWAKCERWYRGTNGGNRHAGLIASHVNVGALPI